MPRFAKSLTEPQTARASARAGRFEAEASLTMTPVGLLAVGGLVAAVLLSVVPIVRASRRRVAPAQIPGSSERGVSVIGLSATR